MNNSSYEVIFENGASSSGSSVDVLIGAVRFRREPILQVWHHTRSSQSYRMQHKLLCDRPIGFREFERMLRVYGASHFF